jgi:glyoxylase-like metal-dependent hydrolase (beta-lactamase superfamily II)
MQGKTATPGRRRHALLKPSILLEIARIRGQLTNFFRRSGTHALTFTMPTPNLLKMKTNMRNPWIPVVPVIFLFCMAAAQDQDFNKVQMKVTKVSGNVYMLEGAGGNIGASVGEDGIVIVDDQYAPMADKIKAALKGITDKPVRFVINTHYHPDHTGGNAIFQQTAPIIAQDTMCANVCRRVAREAILAA